MQSTGVPGLNLGPNWTPLTRTVLVGFFAIYVVQLLLRGTLEAWLAWQPIGEGFAPWQPFTSFLLQGPTPITALIDWIVLYFLLAPLEGILGRKGFLQAIGLCWAVAVAATLALLATGLVQQVGMVLGISPLISALFALFGFLMPNAVIMLMFVLPIRAIWIAWGTGLLTFLFLLYSHELSSALAFFAWGGAWLWIAMRGGGYRRLMLRWKKSRIERQLSRFEVIEGGRGDGVKKKSGTDDWIH